MAERAREWMTEIEMARSLRRVASEPERLLWGHLRSRRLGDIKFRRQVPIGRFIVDFYSHAARVAVEVDGAHHADQMGYDDRRTAWLSEQGVRVLRFGTAEVIRQPQSVLDAIQTACTGHPSSGATRHLLPEGEGTEPSRD